MNDEDMFLFYIIRCKNNVDEIMYVRNLNSKDEPIFSDKYPRAYGDEVFRIALLVKEYIVNKKDFNFNIVEILECSNTNSIKVSLDNE